MREALEWIQEVGPLLHIRDEVKVVVCPTFIDITEVKQAVMANQFPILVGSQDLSPFDAGPYTGEDNAEILKQFVALSILGHSERRQNFGETDEMVAKKVDQALEHDIIPLVCVQDESTPIPEKCNLIAYEPIFAIGTGTPDTPVNANEVAGKIKQSVTRDIEVLYGGSVDADNCQAFVKQENINGLLIGKASLDAKTFLAIVNNCLETLS